MACTISAPDLVGTSVGGGVCASRVHTDESTESRCNLGDALLPNSHAIFDADGNEAKFAEKSTVAGGNTLNNGGSFWLVTGLAAL